MMFVAIIVHFLVGFRMSLGDGCGGKVKLLSILFLSKRRGVALGLHNVMLVLMGSESEAIIAVITVVPEIKTLHTPVFAIRVAGGVARIGVLLVVAVVMVGQD
jgi:hypothetical protein